MSDDYDKKQWQLEQEARAQAQEAYRDKMAKARARSARNAQRKIARLHRKLRELGHISDFEDEFGESVLERLEQYGSAFCDLEKGRAGDALSVAQKQVVARMNKKLKDLKAKQAAGEPGASSDPDADYVRTADRWRKPGKGGQADKWAQRSSFKPKVRRPMPHTDIDVQAPMPVPAELASLTPVIAAMPPNQEQSDQSQQNAQSQQRQQRPFLRLVS